MSPTKHRPPSGMRIKKNDKKINHKHNIESQPNSNRDIQAKGTPCYARVITCNDAILIREPLGGDNTYKTSGEIHLNQLFVEKDQ